MRKNRISVVGLGKLGLPLAVAFANRDFKVIGVDTNPTIIESVQKQQAPFFEPRLSERIQQAGDNLLVTTNIKFAIEQTDITIVIVQSPSLPDGTFSSEYVLSACTQIARELQYKKNYHIIVISSTIMPGECKGVITDRLEAMSGKQVGSDLGLCYIPEFTALGQIIEGFLCPDIVIIGASDNDAALILKDIYSRFCINNPPITIMSLINAEISKIALNCFLTTKITFANQLAHICERIPGANVDIITEAIGEDSRIGKKYLKGATAYGGPCFPRDDKALIGLSNRVGITPLLAMTVSHLNQMESIRLAKIITSHAQCGDEIGILGLAYKPNTDYPFESVGFSLLKLLYQYPIIVYDEHIVIDNSVKTAQICVDRADIVVITIPCKEFRDVRFHKRETVIDCWRILDPDTVRKQGAVYIGLGMGERSI